MKNTLRKAFAIAGGKSLAKMAVLMILALVAVGGAFGQRVGDTIQYAGSTYAVESINGDRVTFLKQQAQANDPVNWVAVADSTFGTSAINGVAWGNNTWVAVAESGKMAYCDW